MNLDEWTKYNIMELSMQKHKIHTLLFPARYDLLFLAISLQPSLTVINICFTLSIYEISNAKLPNTVQSRFFEVKKSKMQSVQTFYNKQYISNLQKIMRH